MHIPDGFLAPAVAAGAGATSLVLVGGALRRVERDLDDRQVPLVGTTAAFVFAAQMLNFPIGLGTSGHVVGVGLVATLMGPSMACLVLALVLIIQALVFGDGGVTALGANILNMGLVGGLVASGVTTALRALLPRSPRGVSIAAGIGAWAAVVAASVACSLELAASGTSPLGLVLPAMTGIHALIGIGEGLVTASVIAVVAAARPELVPGLGIPAGAAAPPPRRSFVIPLGLAALVLVLLAPLASSAPDGLERIAADLGFARRGEGVPAWRLAPLPGYEAPGVQRPGAATIVAGLAGALVVVGAALGGLALLARRRATAS